MTDGYSANVKLFKTKLLCGIETPCVPNPWVPDQNIYLLYDIVHLFKNAYNNFVNKENFICPTLHLNGELHPNFSHIKELYTMELGKVQKMAYKLADKVLNPQVIEKNNVKLADACYHESTINALEYYSNNGFPQFKDTARFCKIICEWFNVVNVRNPEHGKQKKIIQNILSVKMIDMIHLVTSLKYMNGYNIGMTIMVSNKVFPKRHLTRSYKQQKVYLI